MTPVAFSEGVNIFCPSEGKFSFFNSPFPSHYTSTGIDIYMNRGFGERVPSPVEGRIIKIRKVKCPPGRGFRGSGFDFVILLESIENPERVVKVLHVSPTVRCGDFVEPGQIIGRFLRSGYFNFWTDPHIHLEVRRPSDPLRARGGSPFNMLLEVGEIEPIEGLTGIVTEVKPEYALIALKEEFPHGLPAQVGGRAGLLDGGIPHYGFLGVHMRNAPPYCRLVELCGKPIAKVESVHGNICVAKSLDLSLKVEGNKVGLSLYLFPGRKPLMKLIPQKLGALQLERSREISLVIE